MEKKIMTIVNRSTEHPSVPVYSHITRVNEYWSHMVIRPFNEFDKVGGFLIFGLWLCTGNICVINAYLLFSLVLSLVWHILIILEQLFPVPFHCGCLPKVCHQLNNLIFILTPAKKKNSTLTLSSNYKWKSSDWPSQLVFYLEGFIEFFLKC